MIDQKNLTFAFLIILIIIVAVVIFFGKKSNIIESFSPLTTMYLMHKDSADNLATSTDIGITSINSKDKYISGNLTMSGKTSLKGDLSLDNNISIKGKLSIPNIPNYNVEDELRSILNRLKLLEESSTAHNSIINNLKNSATSHNSLKTMV